MPGTLLSLFGARGEDALRTNRHYHRQHSGMIVADAVVAVIVFMAVMIILMMIMTFAWLGQINILPRRVPMRRL